MRIVAAALLAPLGLLPACGGRADAPDAGATTAKTQKVATPPPTAPRPSSPPGDTTIESDGHGGYRVKGGSRLKGDAKSCTAFKACCASRELSLFCGLTEAAETDCAVALRKVKQYATEARVRRPVGCD